MDSEAWALPVAGAPALPSVDPGDPWALPAPTPVATAVRNSLASTYGSNPDQEAALRRAASATGIPLPTARNLPEIVQQQAAQRAFDADMLARKFPRTADLLANQDVMRLAHDDIPATANLEQHVRALAAPPAPAKVDQPIVGKSWLDTLGSAAGGAAKYLFSADGKGLLYDAGRLAFGLGESTNRAAKAASLVMAPLPMLYDAIVGGTRAQDAYFGATTARLDSDTQALELDHDASFGAKAFQSAGSLLGTLAQITLSGGGGAAAPAASTGAGRVIADAAEHGVKAMAFPAVVDALNIGKQVYEQTGDAAQAARAAVAQWGGTSAMGIVPLSAAGTMATRLASGAVSGAASGELSRQWLNGFLPQGMQSGFDPEQTILSALTGAVMGGVMGPRGETSATRPELIQLFRDSDRADQAQRGAAVLDGLAAAAATSKLRERAPDVFKQFIADAAEDGPVKAVYVDGTALAEALHQSGIGTAEMEAKLPGLRADLEQALATGGQVRIPIEDFATHIAGGELQAPLMPHLRVDPMGMTLDESQAFAQSEKQQMQAAVDRSLAAAAADADRQASRQQVYDSVRTQLEATKRFPAPVTDAYAAMTREFYSTMAERLGVAPHELLDQHPIDIQYATRRLTDGSLEQRSPLVFKGAGLPKDGLAPANVGNDGAIYVGPKRSMHFYIADKYFEEAGGFSGDTGFVTPDGQYLDRSQALAWVEANEGPIRVSENMEGELDALDYREASDRRAAKLRDAELEQSPKGWGSVGTADPTSPDHLAPSAGAKGLYNPKQQRITLLEGADYSTFVHESGHFYLDSLAKFAERPDAPAGIAEDMGILLKSFGVDSLETWNKMTLDQQRESHEGFARGFERYMLEGKAPSFELRGLFAKFRSWLLNVYKSLRGLNADLSPEVRGVMDRMLASQDAIADAERARAYMPLFDSPEAAAKQGVTPEQWKEYQALGEEATAEAVSSLSSRTLRDMAWSDNVRSKALKDLAKDASEKRKDLRREVEAEVDKQPVYAAQRFIRHGELAAGDRTNAQRRLLEDASMATTKLDIEALKSMYGDGPAALWRYLRIGGKYGDVTREGGLHPDVAAEIFGFQSGDQMVRAMLDAQPRSDVVAGIVEQRMLERHGEIATPQALSDAADDAVHNRIRTRFIASELKALQQAVGPVREMARAAQEVAERIIEGKRVRDISEREHVAAEARAGKESMKRFAAGDTEGAAVAKRDQLLSNTLARAARDARGEVDQALRYFKRVQRSKTIDADYRDQIEQLLERYQVAPESAREADKRTSLSNWLAAQAEAGLVPDIPPEIAEGVDRKSYQDMTMGELRGLTESVKQIEHLGRLKDRLLTERANRTYQEVRDGIVESVAANANGRSVDPRSATTRSGRWFQRVKGFYSAHIKAATLARIIDGDKTGPLWDAVIRTANERGDHETTERAKATVALSEIMKPFLDGGKNSGKGTFFPTIGRSLNREGVLTMALNMGNDGNMQRLLGGEGWTPEQIRPVLATLRAEDWSVVQKVWDYFETFRPEIAAKERRVYGVEPNWVEPRAFETPTGETLRGGYYPIRYDPRATLRATEHADADAAKAALKGAYSSATTRRSFTKNRVEVVEGRPLLYTLDGLYGGVNDVIHDLAWHEWLIDTNKLMGSDSLDRAIRTTYGADVINQFRSWREDIAAGDGGAQQAIDGMSGLLRQGVGISGLGFNVISAAMQPLGIAQSIPRVGLKWIGRGVMDYIGSPIAKTREANEKSEFMANRMRTRFRDLNELRNRVEGQSSFRENLNQYAYLMMLRTQQMVDVPTWHGAYEKAMSEKPDEASAIAQADQAVIDSQGGGQTKDLAAIERGGATSKLFTVFYSFMNTTLNNLVASGMSERGAGKKAADVVLLTVVPAVLGALLKNAVTPGDSGDDDATLARKLAGEQVSFLFGLMVGTREVADAAKALTSGDHGRDYGGPSGLRVIGDAGKFAQQVKTGEFDDAFRKSAINIAGSLFSLPSAQINRSITGFEALKEGKTKNPAALAFGFQEPR